MSGFTKGIKQMTKEYQLTENELRAAFVLVGWCLKNMGGKRPADLDDDPFTWAYPDTLIEAGWSKEAAAGTWGALLDKGVVAFYDRNAGGWDEFCVCDPFWQWLDTVWDEKGGAALGEKLSRHRSAAALSLRDVEKQTGISKANLSKLERGIHKNPTLDTLTVLAGCYGVTVGALIGEANR
jgi:DNA-binding Xre family transcriptional regulator